MADNQFHTFGVLWEPNKLEWFVNGELVHRVLEPGAGKYAIPGFQDIAPVFDKRMYIIANLAMGLGVFEGENIDSSLFPLKRPSLEIDYIKVWQNPDAVPASAYCGAANGDGAEIQRCDTTIGM